MIVLACPISTNSISSKITTNAETAMGSHLKNPDEVVSVVK